MFQFTLYMLYFNCTLLQAALNPDHVPIGAQSRDCSWTSSVHECRLTVTRQGADKWITKPSYTLTQCVKWGGGGQWLLVNVMFLFLFLIPDHDECAVYSTCSQTCVNTLGSYRCECMEGFSLQANRRSCKAKTGESIHHHHHYNYQQWQTEQYQKWTKTLKAQISYSCFSKLTGFWMQVLICGSEW